MGDHVNKATQRLDTAAVTVQLTNWLSDNARSIEWLAEQIPLAGRSHERKSRLAAIVNGGAASKDEAQAIAEFCGFDVPYTDKPAATKSPFGR